MSERVTEEIFDHFIYSKWPELFSKMAQQASREKVELKDTELFGIYQGWLVLAPNNHQMLEEMGLAECLRPVPDHQPSEVTNEEPHFTDFGIEVITACDNPFIPIR